MLFKSAKQRRTEKVQSSFGQISGDYDAINDIVSLGTHRIWKLQIAEEIKNKKFTRILDACCGTGDMALLLASQDRWLSVTGVDFSGEMLKVAERRRKKKGLDNLTFVRADAEHLSFADGHFDCVVVSYGLSSATDCGKVLRELARVIRPGGFLYCLDSYDPEDERLRPVCGAYRKHVVPMVGAALAGKGAEYRRIAHEESRFLSKRELVDLLHRCGFVKVGYLSHLGGTSACHRAQKPSKEPL